MKIPFDEFMKQLQETNTTFDVFTDFQKVSDNVRKISLKLTQLNYLLGKSDLRQAIKDVFEENRKAFDVMDILVAVRKSDKKKVIGTDSKVHLLQDYFTSVDGVCDYVKGTGLAEVFQSKQITNLVDYVFGIEVGLDSNARKNRGGHVMENKVASIFTDAGVAFSKEVNASEFPELNNRLGKDMKRFDFVIQTAQTTYLIETNFFNGGGSKLNEVARSFSEVAPKVNECKSFEFVWITDGVGWFSAKGKLEEAYKVIPSVYNLTNIQMFIHRVKNELKEV